MVSGVLGEQVVGWPGQKMKLVPAWDHGQPVVTTSEEFYQVMGKKVKILSSF